MTNITRRRFLSWLAPLAVLPVVGPHALLSERPRFPVTSFRLGRIAYGSTVTNGLYQAPLVYKISDNNDYVFWTVGVS